MKEDDEKTTFSHCTKKGHKEDQCWKLHPELKSEWDNYKKSKRRLFL